MPGAEPAATLRLARELISRRSVTPEDGGCQEFLAERLARLGFTIEPVRRGEVTNLWARSGGHENLDCRFRGGGRGFLGETPLASGIDRAAHHLRRGRSRH